MTLFGSCRVGPVSATTAGNRSQCWRRRTSTIDSADGSTGLGQQRIPAHEPTTQCWQATGPALAQQRLHYTGPRGRRRLPGNRPTTGHALSVLLAGNRASYYTAISIETYTEILTHRQPKRQWPEAWKKPLFIPFLEMDLCHAFACIAIGPNAFP